MIELPKEIHDKIIKSCFLKQIPNQNLPPVKGLKGPFKGLITPLKGSLRAFKGL